jgi:GrpB-like predicted nucleotidyltransferase (UPF0157 family)
MFKPVKLKCSVKQMQQNKRNPSSSAMTEDEILAVTVGGRTPHNGPIKLDTYNHAWPVNFLEIEQKIRNALGSTATQIEHVGSTSVSGLSAKPIIDVLLVVADSADEESYVPPLEDNGFHLRIREPDWYEHRLLKSENVDTNVHVFSIGCKEIYRLLAFRDWLRINDSDRMLYEASKRELAARTWQYTQNYADAKSDIVEEILTRAQGSQ